MDRNQLIMAIAAVLFLVFALGWLLHWLTSKLSHRSGTHFHHSDDMAARLHAAENELEDTRRNSGERERELLNRIAQTEAERDAAMSGLGNARRISEELRKELAALKGN